MSISRSLLSLFSFAFATMCVAAEKPKIARSGIAKRTPWTTSGVVGSPDPPAPYRTEVAFPKLKFDSPLAMNRVPGGNRLAVGERYGKVFTFESRPAATQQLLIDVKRTLYGLAFHPQFPREPFVFLTSIDANRPAKEGTLVSRFVVDPVRMTADLASEKVLLQWPVGGHNGGCLRFGPDGFLYIATGDSSGIADELLTGQDLSDLSGAILRIDVDKSGKKRAYAVPADNPFVGTRGARPEIYSYGHRQPWKFSFDRDGRLFAGEVGQDLWEMIHLIKKGGNYGWSVREGKHPFRPERKKGPTPFVEPIVEHNHDHFRSITGGYVSYTRRLPGLAGQYVYGDYDTGRVWAFRYDQGRVTHHRELCDTQMRVVAFGQDNAGEVYIVDFVGGRLHRLVKAPPPSPDAPKFPRKLSETGLFASTKDHTPAAGVLPYSVNAPLYSDNAAKDRFIAIPGDGRIEFDAVTYPQPAPGAPPGWRFPDGTVLVKTFSLELEPGNLASRRRLETRILHHIRMPGNDNEYGAQVWKGYTYIWNDEQTDAELLRADGLNRTLTIVDPKAPGGRRKQSWRFPSRAECTLCHTMSAKYVLGVNTLQMNKLHDYGGVKANQLDTLEHIGLFAKPLPRRPDALPKLADYRDPHATLDARARSYLHANCSHCHRKWGGGNAEFQLLAPLPLAETGTIGVKPQQGRFGLTEPALLVPGDTARSMILHRMQLTKLGRMPHVSSRVVDEAAVALIAKWVRELPGRKTSSLFNARNLDGWKAQRGKGVGEWISAAVSTDKPDSRQFTFKADASAKDRVLVNGKQGRTVNLLTKAEFGDIEAHIEFMVPQGSNSGVYFQGRYEVQILDSYGVKKPKYGDCGGIYQRSINGKGAEGHPPRVNASKPPGQWQSFDVVFRAPRFDKNGKKIANARFVKVVHNGKLIHENVEVTGPTVAAAFGDEKPTGPLMLQGDHGPVAYRNLSIRTMSLSSTMN